MTDSPYVYVRFVKDFERDKEILRNFVKKYSGDAYRDLYYIDNCLVKDELYNDNDIVAAYLVEGEEGFWLCDESDLSCDYRDVTNECARMNKLLGEL